MSKRRTIYLGKVVDLTLIEWETFTALQAFYKREGIYPSVRELAQELGLAADSAALKRLQKLKALGAVDWETNRSRTLHIICDTVTRVEDTTNRQVAEYRRVYKLYRERPAGRYG